MSTRVGRRVDSIAEITQPGDYCGPALGWTGPGPGVSAEAYAADRSLGLLACFFLLPNARDEDAPPGQRSIHHVCFPPHTYRECDDGSLEIRASIGAMPFWHGYLDEGHIWREC
jgi:hypothetical protein